MKNLSRTIKQQKIMWITLLILLLASLLCHSLPKISDVNWQTILSLFSLMLVTQYFIHIKALDYLSQKIINLARTHRQVAQLLVLLAGFLAMFLTNDVAILSLIPLFLVIHKQVHGPFVFPLSLITIAANLGSALTPFGNPQNLYIYNHYQLSTPNFFKISFPLFLISFALLLLTTFTIPATPLPTLKQTNYNIKPLSLITAFALLIVTLAGVLHFIPLIYTTIAIALAV
ncbi:MAG: SLC13 family permease, partial [Lactobacillus sp.]|nr:SLC13 family permease [Lactobacillus sp.]